MKELKWSGKSWHGILWRSTWGNYLPDNICGYFWSLLGAIAVAPLAIIGHVINLCCRKVEVIAIWWVLYPMICFGIGSMMEIADKVGWNIHHKSLWYIWDEGLLVGTLASLSVIAMFTVWFLCSEYRESHPREKKLKQKKANPYPVERAPNPLIEGWKAFKGKYCTKIKWE